MAHVYARGRRFWVQWYEEGRRVRRVILDPTTGEPVATIEQAQAIAAELERRLDRQRRLAIPGAPTFAELLRRFLADKADRREAATLAWYRKHGRHFEARFPCQLRIPEITAEDVSAYLSARLRIDQVAKVTVNKERATLATIFNWAIKRGLCDRNPVHAVDPYAVRPKPSEPCPTALYEDLVASLRAAAAEKKNLLHRWMRELVADLAEILWHTGMRAGEACALLRADVNRDQGIMILRSAANKGPRELPIPVEIRGILERRCALGRDLVLTTHDGGPAYDSIYLFWHRWIEAHPEHARAHFHSMRHAYQRRLEDAGERPETIMRLMGHATVKMHGHYSHRDMDALRAAQEKLSGAVAKPPPPRRR